MATRILVVDDEPLVLECVTRFLGAAGYEPIGAPGAKHALEVLASYDRIDLVISDVVMPEMRGPELVAEISCRWPNTAMMLMSGYANAANVRGIAFISKPFSRADLLAKVAEVLASAQQTCPESVCKSSDRTQASPSKERTG